MNPTTLRILGIVAVIAPIAVECISKLIAKQPVDWSYVITAVSSALGGSQLLKRAGDLTPAQVEQHVASLSIPPKE